jgi:hypothetical protein
VISQVTAEQVDVVWPHFLPMVERALRHGQGDAMAPCDVFGKIKSGDWILWIAHEGEDVMAGVVIEVSQFPRKKVVFVVMLVGSRWDEWADDLEKVLLEFKELNHADCIETSCRDGLVKKLGKRGWGRKATIMELK